MKLQNVICTLLFAVNGLMAQEDPGAILEDRSLDSLLNIKTTTAAKYLMKASEAPSSISIITSQDIQDHGYQTLDEVLDAARGFYTSYDRNYSYVGIRGFSRPTDYNDRLLLLLNGHTLNEGFYGSAPLGSDFPIDLHAVDYIEIVRGPGSALYGSGAMFAVINIVTKKGVALDAMHVGVQVGSYGRRQGSFEFGKELKGGVDILISGQWADIKGADLYFPEYNTDSTSSGIARNLDWEKYYGMLSTIRFGDLTFQGSFTSRSKGIPTASYETIFNDPRSSSLDQVGFAELKYEHELTARLAISLRGYFDLYHYEGNYPYPDEFDHDGTDNRRLGTELQARWDLSPTNRLVGGMEFIRNYRSDYFNKSTDSVLFDGDFPFSIASLYAQDEIQISEAITVVAGLRHDQYSSISSSLTPRFALIANPFASSTAKVLIGQAYRAPNNYELYYADPLLFKSNPGLFPEKITTYEFVWDQKISGTTLASISLYDNTINDLIDPRIDPSDSLLQNGNVSKVHARGIEAELMMQLKEGLHFDVSATYGTATNTASDIELTNFPKFVVKGRISLPVTEVIRLGLDGQYESSRTTVYETHTDPWFVLNLSVAARLAPLVKNLAVEPSFSLRVNNLLNRWYQYPGGFEHRQPALTQNGRNFILTLAATF
ncbi:MAG: TonB-dependent receptor [Ignavibacteriales bacterium]|nr:TonB-dependent receptor [Ignavibacteriales bacterium]